MFNLKKKNCLGNKKSLSLMLSIVALRLKKIKVSVPAPFRHRYRFKSIGYVPVSDKNQTIPSLVIKQLKEKGIRAGCRFPAQLRVTLETGVKTFPTLVEALPTFGHSGAGE